MLTEKTDTGALKNAICTKSNVENVNKRVLIAEITHIVAK